MNHTQRHLAAAIDDLDESTPGDDAMKRLEIRTRVARLIAERLARTVYGTSTHKTGRSAVSKRDVAVIMSAYGASHLTINVHAGLIAGMIRNDFTDGGTAR